MKEQQSLTTGQALAISMMSWIQSQGKQQTLEVIRSGQQMDTSIPAPGSLQSHYPLLLLSGTSYE